MEDRQRRLEERVSQVGVEGGELGRQHQPLVDDGAAGERRHVEAVDALLGDPPLGILAGAVQRALERRVVHQAVGPCDDHLANLGPGVQRLLAERAEVDGDLAPAHDGQALGAQRVVHQGGAEIAGDEVVAWQERHAERQVFRPVDAEAALLGLADEEPARELGQDAAAVAGLSVGVDGTAVGDVGDRLERLDEDVVVLKTGNPCDEADAAGIMLVARFVQRRVHPTSMPSAHALTSRHHKRANLTNERRRGSRQGQKRPALCDDRPAALGDLARFTGVTPPPVWERRARP